MIHFLKKKIRFLIPDFLISFYHWIWAFTSAVFYRFPSRKIIVIGVTGTKGKTSVLEILNAILESFGCKTALTSSLRFKIGEKSVFNSKKMTMPGRFFLQRFLRKAVDNGCRFALLEATSEGMKQCRHCFIDFDLAIMINLRPEHLESHNNSFENYRLAKEKLFSSLNSFKKERCAVCDRKGKIREKQPKTMIINYDDYSAKFFLNHWADEKIGFGLSEKNFSEKILPFFPQSFSYDNKGIDFVVDNLNFHSPLKGEFNLYNILAGLAAAQALGFPLQGMKKAIGDFSGIPGRMEEIQEGQNFKAFVDFAHTPDSLEAVYKTVRQEIKKDAPLVCVLGSAGGGRDKWKRPEMGKVAAVFCDEIIITNEDSYDEDPLEIINQVAEGVKSSNRSCLKIKDRKEAIFKAVKMTEAGGALIITGKGAERVMAVNGGKKIPWDDREVLRQAIRENA